MNCNFSSKTARITFGTLFISALLLLSCSVLFAQVTSGTIFGTVKDPSGAVISGATVTIANPTNGLTRTIASSDTGDFVAPNLLPGTYSITVAAPGFKKL